MATATSTSIRLETTLGSVWPRGLTVVCNLPVEPAAANSSLFALLGFRECTLDLVNHCLPLLRLLAFLRVQPLLGAVAHHDAVKLLVADFALVLLYLLLQGVDCEHVLALLLVPFFLRELLDSLVELLVLFLALLFFKFRNSLLLLQKTRFHFPHVVICLQHLSEEVVRPADWHIRLNCDFHRLHDVLAGCIVEADLAFDVLVHLQLLGCFCQLEGLRVGHRHVLHERDLALLLDKVLRLESIVEALLDFVQPLSDRLRVVDGTQTEPLKLLFLELFLCQIWQVFIVVGVVSLLARRIAFFGAHIG